MGTSCEDQDVRACISHEVIVPERLRSRQHTCHTSFMTCSCFQLFTQVNDISRKLRIVCYDSIMTDSDYEFLTLDPRINSLVTIPYEVFRYPMGDATVRRVTGGDSVESTVQVMWVHGAAPDWTLITQWARYMTTSERNILVLPYLPSARGDKDNPSPAKINARMAAMSGITDIITLDPHSTVWLYTLRVLNASVRQHVLDLAALVRTAVGATTYDGVISPDEGARQRASEVASKLNVPVSVAKKVRNPENGNILDYIAPADVGHGRYLVVDDICDGGGTFALLAKACSSTVLDLWVSHGGFTKGVTGLLDQYSHVYTTDSLESAREAAYRNPRVSAVELRGPVTSIVAEIVKGLQ